PDAAGAGLRAECEPGAIGPAVDGALVRLARLPGAHGGPPSQVRPRARPPGLRDPAGTPGGAAETGGPVHELDRQRPPRGTSARRPRGRPPSVRRRRSGSGARRRLRRSFGASNRQPGWEREARMDVQAMKRRWVKRLLAPLLSWSPLRDPADGFSIVLGTPWALRQLLPVNLRFLAGTDRRRLDKVLVIFDRVLQPGADAFVQDVAWDFRELPLEFHFHPPLP